MSEPESTRNGIIAAGCWTLDRIKIVDVWPAEEELSRIIDTDLQGGGSAHNLGIDIRRLDSNIPVFAIGKIGMDSDGKFLLKAAESAGIDVSQLHQTDDAETSYTDVITASQTGRRTFFHHSGTNDLLTPDDFNFTDSSAKIAHFGLPGVHSVLDQPWKKDPNGWVAILKKAQSAGIATNLELISIDAERNREICLPCLPHLNYLIVNDHEIGSLASMDTCPGGDTNAEACEEAAHKVLSLGSMAFVTVHYPGGAVCVSRDEKPLYSDAAIVEEKDIVGTVGAGDAFSAGMLYGVHQRWPLEQALRLAHATAAASLRSANTVDAVGTVRECLATAKFIS